MSTVKQARDFLAAADLIHSEETVSAAVRRVAAEITERLQDANPVLLCVMSGGVPFAGHLMTQLQFPLDFDYLHVTRYGQDTTGGALSWRAARAMWIRPDSSGSRRVSSTLRSNSGNSSRNTTPWWASEISPGRGGLPPPTSATAEAV